MQSSNKIKNIIAIIILIIAIVVGSIIYSKYNFNDFTKSVREKGKTSFSRDNKEKYSKVSSYKIENKEYNDSMFYKTINVQPNKPYKVTCMVKTQNVKNKDDQYYGGAQIAIKDTLECSKSVTGTSDWTELTFMFNSKNRDSIELGFRLGGYNEMSIGEAWFTDFKIEEGILDSDNNWNVACFIIKNLNITANVNNQEKKFNLKVSTGDMDDVENNLRRAQDTFRNLSQNKMTMTYDTYVIDTPLTKISYDPENEYYIDPGDVKDLIDPYLKKKEYDYIYVVARFGDLNQGNDVLVHDWIGLGSMDYYGIGYSNIRLPDSANSYLYKYSSRNTFPEEVFIHEFLHTLERNEKEYGNTNIGALHDYEKYGYQKDSADGLKKWYGAYMQNAITNTNGTRAGLTQTIYTSKPVQKSNFKYSYELNYLDDPQNFIEEIISIINRMKKAFKK